MIPNSIATRCAYCYGHIPEHDIRISNYSDIDYPRFPPHSEAHLECFISEIKENNIDPAKKYIKV